MFLMPLANQRNEFMNSDDEAYKVSNEGYKAHSESFIEECDKRVELLRFQRSACRPRYTLWKRLLKLFRIIK